MNWPWSAPRTTTIVVKHRVYAPDLARAISKLAEAQRYAARCGCGIVHAKAKDEKAEIDELAAWSASHPDVDPIEREDIATWRAQIRGDLPCDAEQRRIAGMEYALRRDRYGLPEAVTAPTR